MQFSYFYLDTNEKKPDEKTTLLHDGICHDCDIARASGKMHHGILFDRRLLPMQVLLIVLIFISFNKWTIDEFLALGVSGYLMHQFEWTKVKLTKSCRQMTGEMNILLEAVVKGHYQCPFTIRAGETFALDE